MLERIEELSNYHFQENVTFSRVDQHIAITWNQGKFVNHLSNLVSLLWNLTEKLYVHGRKKTNIRNENLKRKTDTATK